MKFLLSIFMFFSLSAAVASDFDHIDVGFKNYGDFDSLSQVSYTYQNDDIFWKEDVGTYSGPLLEDVLKDAGIWDTYDRFLVYAYDDFSNLLTKELIVKYKPILATHKNGVMMTLHEKGKYRIMFSPKFKNTSKSSFRLHWVWLIKYIEGSPN